MTWLRPPCLIEAMNKFKKLSIWHKKTIIIETYNLRCHHIKCLLSEPLDQYLRLIEEKVHQVGNQPKGLRSLKCLNSIR